MKQEDKELLLKDLCARLPYKCKYYASTKRTRWHKPTLSTRTIDNIINDYYDEIKPYLRSMSNMTKEERKEFSKLLDKRYCEEDWEGHISVSYCIEIDEVYIDDGDGIDYPTTFSMDAIDYLNSYHFDYRGLIEKGLAIAVTKENNPYK